MSLFHFGGQMSLARNPFYAHNAVCTKANINSDLISVFLLNPYVTLADILRDSFLKALNTIEIPINLWRYICIDIIFSSLILSWPTDKKHRSTEAFSYRISQNVSLQRNIKAESAVHPLPPALAYGCLWLASVRLGLQTMDDCGIMGIRTCLSMSEW